MTWARKTEPESQKLLSDGYNEIGKELGAVVVPAGTAWELMLDKHDKPELHAKDGSHPSVAGTYLAAYTFYATLFGKPPAKLNTGSGDLTAEDHKLLQEYARAAYRTASG